MVSMIHQFLHYYYYTEKDENNIGQRKIIEGEVEAISKWRAMTCKQSHLKIRYSELKFGFLSSFIHLQYPIYLEELWRWIINYMLCKMPYKLEDSTKEGKVLFLNNIWVVFGDDETAIT